MSTAKPLCVVGMTKPLAVIMVPSELTSTGAVPETATGTDDPNGFIAETTAGMALEPSTLVDPAVVFMPE